MESFFRYLLLIFCLLGLGKPDLDSDRTALLAFRSAIGKSLPWNRSRSPCEWQGVQCNDGRVTVLRLPGNHLTGSIPTGVIGNLTHLRILSLRLNSLSGTLPEDLGACTDLRNLYLQGNRFSCEIPSSVFRLQKLVRLNLAGNNFTGGLSPAFGNLTRLQTLYLENNRFSGEIPSLELPTLVQFNVSYNPFNGSIPPNFSRMKSESFIGTSLCGKPLDPCPGEKV